MATPIEILHVEDDPEIRIIVELSLSLDPHLRVVSAASGDEALSLMEQGTTTPSVILLDYYIDRATGVDVLKELRKSEAWADIPVAFLTARVRASDINEMMASGAVGVLPKPFNPITLAQELRALIGI